MKWFVFGLLVMMLTVGGFTLAQDNPCVIDLTSAQTLLDQAKQTENQTDQLKLIGQVEAALQLQRLSCLASAGETRANPVPYGESHEVSVRGFDGTMRVAEFVDNADFSDASSSNEPDSGNKYVSYVVELTCGRAATESCTWQYDRLVVIGDDGIVYPSDRHLNGLDFDAEFFGGATLSFHFGSQVPEGLQNFILLTDDGNEDTERVYFAAQ